MNFRLVDWLEHHRVLAISVLNALVLVTLAILIGAASLEPSREAFALSRRPEAEATAPESRDLDAEEPADPTPGLRQPAVDRHATREAEARGVKPRESGSRDATPTRTRTSQRLESTRVVPPSSTRSRGQRSREERSRIRDALSDERARLE